MKNCILVLLLILDVGFVNAQNTLGTIEIQITNIDNTKSGYIWIGLYNSKKAFGKIDGAIKVLYIPIKDKTAHVKFTDVEYDTYSINIFHDENSNKKIDTNFIGIPTEGYGFSNNPNFIGPPSFEKTKFKFTQSISRLSIKMCY